MRRVLVTGAAGFLGGHVCARLQAAGAAVRGLDLTADGLPQGVEPAVGSITDAATVRRALDGVDALVHGAAIADLWRRDPRDFERVNLEGARLVFGLAREAGIARAVHISSYTTLIAGPCAEPEAPLDETVELAPEALLGPYPAAKRRAELAAQDAAAQGLPLAIVLPTAPVGPGDARPTPPGKLLQDLAAGRLPAFLDCLMNLVDARAAADGIVAALDRGAPGRRYLLAGEDVEMRELVARVARISGTPPPRFAAPGALALAAAQIESGLSAVTGDPPSAPLTGVRLALRRRRFDAARARKELDFSPGPLDAALRDALEWARGRDGADRNRETTP